MTASSSIAATARALVEARRDARALAEFPGSVPETLDDAYEIQAVAIRLWPDEIVGWKVGRLSPDLAERFGTDRFLGPIFGQTVTSVCPSGVTGFAMFEGGSAAFEAEFVIYAGQGASGAIEPARMAIGIEVAASPVAPLPALGSLATIADMGNNAGQIIGPEVALGLLSDPQALVCETKVGCDAWIAKTAASLPGGPQAGFAFAVAEAERIGRPLRPGQFISTGAVTGMHAVVPGQPCVARFGRLGTIECLATARLAI